MQMSMKPIFGAALLGIAMPMAAVADPQEKADALVTILNLEGERATQVQQTIQNYYQQKKEVKEQAYDQIKRLKEQKEQDMQAILTEEEYQRYQAIQELDKGKRKHKDKDWEDDEQR